MKGEQNQHGCASGEGDNAGLMDVLSSGSSHPLLQEFHQADPSDSSDSEDGSPNPQHNLSTQLHSPSKGLACPSSVPLSPLNTPAILSYERTLGMKFSGVTRITTT